MFRVILFLLIFSPVATVLAAPALVVDNVTHDFGEVVQGNKITETFRFRNAGDEVLEISSLRSSCGCTAALLTSRRLAPGAMGELTLTFNSSGFRGSVQKRVTFSTNDPAHPSVGFALQGKVTPELTLTPERINWGVVTLAMPLHAEIEVRNTSSKTITLQSPTVTNSAIVAKVSALKIAPGEQVRLAVTASFPEGKKRLAGYIMIATDLQQLPQLRISVSARLARE